MPAIRYWPPCTSSTGNLCYTPRAPLRQDLARGGEACGRQLPILYSGTHTGGGASLKSSVDLLLTCSIRPDDISSHHTPQPGAERSRQPRHTAYPLTSLFSFHSPRNRRH